MHSRTALLTTLAIIFCALVAAAPTAAFASVPAPTIDSEVTVTGTGAVDEDLDCDATYTALSATLTYTWKTSGGAVLLTGADESTLTVPLTAAGDTVTCTFTVSNSSGSVSKTSAPLAIADALPEFPADATAKVTLGHNCRFSPTSAATKVTGGHIAITYAWVANGQPVAETGSILTAFVPVGATGHCVITATNSAGSASISGADVALSPDEPTITHRPHMEGTGAIGAPLTCVGAAFSRSDWQLTTTWYGFGSDVEAASFTPTMAELGKKVSCRVTARSGSASVLASDVGASLTVWLPIQATFAKKQIVRPLAATLGAGLVSKLVINQASCSASVTVTIPGVLARKLGLAPKKSKAGIVAIGTNTATRLPTAATITTKLTAAAKRKLAKQPAVRMTHLITLICGSGSTAPAKTIKRAVTVKAAAKKKR